MPQQFLYPQRAADVRGWLTQSHKVLNTNWRMPLHRQPTCTVGVAAILDTSELPLLRTTL